MSSNPLIKAAKHKNLAALRDAIRAGVDLNDTDVQGWSPLFHAARSNWIEGLQELISAGANVNHGVENGFTALFSAVLNGHLRCVRVLLEANAQVCDVQGFRLGTYAQGRDRVQIIKALEHASDHDTSK